MANTWSAITFNNFEFFGCGLNIVIRFMLIWCFHIECHKCFYLKFCLSNFSVFVLFVCFQLLSSMVEKLRNYDDDPLPQDLQEGVDDDEWVWMIPFVLLVFAKFQVLCWPQMSKCPLFHFRMIKALKDRILTWTQSTVTKW